MQKRTFVKAMALATSSPVSLFAQSTAGRPIRMLVPLPAGTSNDFATRVISPAMGQVLGQPVLLTTRRGPMALLQPWMLSRLRLTA